jgi:predicted SnoaL-like aldol condensation-catalyzing enzyme
MVEFLKTLPPPAETDKSPIVHLVEQGDMVVAHLDLHFMGKDIRVIELFRVQDGKAAEHWDVTEERSSETVPYIPVQTGVSVGDRQSFLTQLYAGLSITIHRIINEGNFIAVHGEAKDGNHPVALFDVFQFEDDKLIAHWSAKQVVPEKLMHGNGMF